MGTCCLKQKGPNQQQSPKNSRIIQTKNPQSQMSCQMSNHQKDNRTKQSNQFNLSNDASPIKKDKEELRRVIQQNLQLTERIKSLEKFIVQSEKLEDLIKKLRLDQDQSLKNQSNIDKLRTCIQSLRVKQDLIASLKEKENRQKLQIDQLQKKFQTEKDLRQQSEKNYEREAKKNKILILEGNKNNKPDETTIVSLNTKIEELSASKQQVQKQLSECLEQLGMLKNQKQQTETKNSQLKKQIDQLNKQDKQHLSTIENLQKQLINKETFIKKQSQLMIEKQSESSDIKQKFKEQSSKIKDLQQQIGITEQLRDSIKTNNKLQEMQNLCRIAQIQRQKIADLYQTTNKELVELRNSYYQLENRFNLVNSQVNYHKAQTQTASHQLQIVNFQHQAQIDALQKQIRLLDEQLSASVNEIKTSHSNLAKLQQDLKNKNFQCQKLALTAKFSSRCFSQYFNGDILNIDSAESTEWLVNNLQKFIGKQIRSTRFLYKRDDGNSTNFHKYIDEKPHIFLLVKMYNDQIIACYSEAPFKSKSNVDYKEGFMFGLKNRRIFSRKVAPTNANNRTPPRPITYDDYFLIWGNSDLRIRSGKDELYSNYATSNASFEEVGNKTPAVRDLFLMDDRETVLQNYEIYQIFFEEKSRFE